jgi:hypothetical protein
MSDKPFTVTDRRLFTPEGERRPEAEEREPESAPAPQPAGARSAAAPPPVPDHRPTEPTPPADAPGETRPGAADFGEFVLSLADQAGALLSDTSGEIPPGEALAGARSIVAILEMLADKTKGRLTPREEEILQAVLYQLRMAYVARARVVGG